MSEGENKSHVFEKEVEILEKSQTIINSSNKEVYNLEEEYANLTNYYAQLLEETRLITRVSDRLQNKINRANDKLLDQSEKINTINGELQRNNDALKSALEQLTKAKISNRANTIVLIFALILFLFSEGILEPIVESRVDNIWLGLLFKGMIFALLKPIEMIVEKYLERKSTGRDRIAEELLR